MEFGYRALCNRTILYHAKDRTVNKWLNKRLNRTEFMHFAPVTMWEHAKDCYLDIEGAERSAEYMTILSTEYLFTSTIVFVCVSIFF